MRRALGLALLVSLAAACSSPPTAGDEAWWRPNDATRAPDPATYGDGGVVRSSRYVTMRDGVSLAVDVYLPRDLPVGSRVPTLLTLTRYGRDLEGRWPFRRLVQHRFAATIRALVTHGYAWVYVDARGSAASFGSRPYPYSQAEIDDGVEILDWIGAQPWSSGAVGLWGSSYTAGSAMWLAARGHPAVKAVMARFVMFDAFPEVVFPGGLHLAWLTETWGALARAIDTNRLPRVAGVKAALAVKGIRPVDDDPKGTLLAQAVADHGANGDIAALPRGVVFRDDESAILPGVTVDAISPHRALAAVQRAGVPIYLVTGWWDAAFVRSAVHWLWNLGDPRTRLTIGPWDHGGYTAVSPYAPAREPAFDDEGETLRFFDTWLKGLDRGLTQEPRVHWFTLGEERWKAGANWPPAAEERALYLGADQRLAWVAPGEAGADAYVVDPEAGTGHRTRWESLVNLDRDRIEYPHRARADRRLLVYESAPLGAPLEVTGHPIAALHVASSADDAAVFAYLEEVSADGRVHYVSEGMLRALHRRRAEGDAPYRTRLPYRSFLRRDGDALTPGQPAELVFDLLPISYRFARGSRVRLAIAGADADHFAPLPEPAPTLTLHRGPGHPSRLLLPVVP